MTGIVNKPLISLIKACALVVGFGMQSAAASETLRIACVQMDGITLDLTNSVMVLDQIPRVDDPDADAFLDKGLEHGEFVAGIFQVRLIGLDYIPELSVAALDRIADTDKVDPFGDFYGKMIWTSVEVFEFLIEGIDGFTWMKILIDTNNLEQTTLEFGEFPDRYINGYQCLPPYKVLRPF